MTSLEELDLSHNELTELPEATGATMFPINLTRLQLQHNRLSTLPLPELLALKPSILDLRANDLHEFAEELSYLVENETQLLIAGNAQFNYIF